MDIQKIRNLYQQAVGMDKQIVNTLEQKKTDLAYNQKRLKLIEEGQVFLQKVAQETQEHLRFQIEDIVNLALETCFPGEYIFQIQFNVSRGKTDAELVFIDQRSGKPIDPMEASGGGVVDLTCFALRIASYALESGTDNLIILDEPFRFLSRDLQARAGEILKTLSEKMNLQIILVSHIPELIDVADKIFTVKKNIKGVSEVSSKLG